MIIWALSVEETLIVGRDVVLRRENFVRVRERKGGKETDCLGWWVRLRIRAKVRVIVSKLLMSNNNLILHPKFTSYLALNLHPPYQLTDPDPNTNPNVCHNL